MRLNFAKEFDTAEAGIEELKKTVSTRNCMGGALHWNMLNDDCLQIADELYYAMGVDKQTIQDILDGKIK